MSAYDEASTQALTKGQTGEGDAAYQYPRALPQFYPNTSRSQELPSAYDTPYRNNHGMFNLSAYDGNATASQMASTFSSQSIAAPEHGTAFQYDPRHPSMLPSFAAPFAHPKPETLVYQKDQPLPGLYFESQDQVGGVPKSWQPAAGLGSQDLQSGSSRDLVDEEMEEGELDAAAVGEGANSSGQVWRPEATETLDGALRLQKEHAATCHLVKELHSWGLSFRDMLAEVTHPEALRAVFEDLDLPTDVDDASKTAPQMMERSSTEEHTHSRYPVADHAADTMAEKQPLVTHLASTGTSSFSLTQTASPSSNVSAKQQQPLDRKALIAQKLAAKSAKSRASPIVDPSATESPGPSQLKQTVQSASLEPNASLSISDGGNLTSRAQGEAKSGAEADSEREALRAAQTELARQRMEAFKQRNVERSVQNGQNPAIANQREGSSESTETSRRTSTQQASEIVHSLLETRASETSHGPSNIFENVTFNIPGLMSETDPLSPPQGKASELFDGGDGDISIKDIHPPYGGSQAGKSATPQVPSRETDSVHLANDRNHDVQTVDYSRQLPQGDANVVIDISDDENEITHIEEDQAASIEADTTAQDTDDRTIQAINQVRGQGIPAKTVIATTDQALNGIGPSSSALSTPKRGEIEVLTEKQKQIEILHQRIAQLEANSKARRGKSTPLQFQEASMSSTPMDFEISRPDSSKTPRALPNPAAVALSHKENSNISSDHQSPAMDSHTPDVASQMEADGHQTYPREDLASKLAMQAGDENAIVDSAVKGEAKPREARREEIELGLPLLDAEIERTRQRLQILRQQEASLEAEIKKGLEGRRMLLQELQRLSHPVELSATWDQSGKAVDAVSTPSMTARRESTSGATQDDKDALLDEIDLRSDRSPHASKTPLEACQTISETASLREEQSRDSMSISFEESTEAIDDGLIRQIGVDNVEATDLEMGDRTERLLQTEDFEVDEVTRPGLDPSNVLDIDEAVSAEKASSDVDENIPYEPPTHLSPIAISQTPQLEADADMLDASLDPNSEFLQPEAFSKHSFVNDSGSQQSQADDSDEYEPPESIGSLGTPISKNAAVTEQDATEIDVVSEHVTDPDIQPTQQRFTHYTPYESPLQHFRQSES